MCLRLYIASDVELAQVPAQSPPGPLSVRAVEDVTAGVRGHLSKAHLYVAGAHTGCACGFTFGPNAEHAEMGVGSVRELRAYLASALVTASELEMYSCWEGDEGNSVEHRERIDVTWLGTDADAFAFPERWLATLSSAHAREIPRVSEL
jgi:hypothetical protein